MVMTVAIVGGDCANAGCAKYASEGERKHRCQNLHESFLPPQEA